jgi:hypothetical protein
VGKGEFENGGHADDPNDFLLFKEVAKGRNKLFYDADADGDGKKMLFATVKRDTDLTHDDLKVVEDLAL